MLLHNENGQALVEYVLIIAIITVALIAMVKMFGGVISDKLTESTCELTGQKYHAGDSAGEGYCK